MDNVFRFNKAEGQCRLGRYPPQTFALMGGTLFPPPAALEKGSADNHFSIIP